MFMKVSLTLTVLVLVFAAGMGAGQATRRESPVTLIELPLKLPAVGNLTAVREWRFGRLQQVEQIGANADIILQIRTPNGAVHRVIGPRAELTELARQSNWVDASKARPGGSDYTERMIAFDVDGQQRLIAMISLEPMNRSRNRLRRALRP